MKKAAKKEKKAARKELHGKVVRLDGFKARIMHLNRNTARIVTTRGARLKLELSWEEVEKVLKNKGEIYPGFKGGTQMFGA